MHPSPYASKPTLFPSAKISLSSYTNLSNGAKSLSRVLEIEVMSLRCNVLPSPTLGRLFGSSSSANSELSPPKWLSLRMILRSFVKDAREPTIGTVLIIPYYFLFCEGRIGSLPPLEPTILLKAHSMSTAHHTHMCTHTHWCHSTCTCQQPPLFGLGKTELSVTDLFNTTHLIEIAISLFHLSIIPWYKFHNYIVSTFHN